MRSKRERTLVTLALLASGMTAQGSPAQADYPKPDPDEGTKFLRLAMMLHKHHSWFTYGIGQKEYRLRIVTQTEYKYWRRPGPDLIKAKNVTGCWTFTEGEDHHVFQGVKIQVRVWQDDDNTRSVVVEPFHVKDDGTVQNCRRVDIPKDDEKWIHWRDRETGRMAAAQRATGEVEIGPMMRNERWVGNKHWFHPNYPDLHLDGT